MQLKKFFILDFTNAKLPKKNHLWVKKIYIFFLYFFHHFLKTQQNSLYLTYFLANIVCYGCLLDIEVRQSLVQPI